MQDVLVSEDWLKSKDRQTRECLEDVAKKYVPRIDDTDFGTAFRYFLLFEHCPELVSESFETMSAERIFYNKYFWFCRFASLYASKLGPDAGIEQQQFK